PVRALGGLARRESQQRSSVGWGERSEPHHFADNDARGARIGGIRKSNAGDRDSNCGQLASCLTVLDSKAIKVFNSVKHGSSGVGRSGSSKSYIPPTSRKQLEIVQWVSHGKRPLNSCKNTPSIKAMSGRGTAQVICNTRFKPKMADGRIGRQCRKSISYSLKR